MPELNVLHIGEFTLKSEKPIEPLGDSSNPHGGLVKLVVIDNQEFIGFRLNTKPFTQVYFNTSPPFEHTSGHRERFTPESLRGYHETYQLQGSEIAHAISNDGKTIYVGLNTSLDE